MKFIENKLEALDAYFAPKKESDKLIIFAGIALVIGYLGYALFYDDAKKMYNSSEQTKLKLEKKIKENQSYIKSISVGNDIEYYVKQHTKTIQRRKSDLSSLKGRISVITKNLNQLSDMLFNKKSWAKFLDSITDRANAQNVEIQYIKNKYVDNNGAFGHVLEIAVGCKGEYKSIVKFMNELEQNTLVTDIYGSKLKLDSNATESNLTETNSTLSIAEGKTNEESKDIVDIVADINISVWGVNR